jgi:hypothetical protein
VLIALQRKESEQACLTAKQSEATTTVTTSNNKPFSFFVCAFCKLQSMLPCCDQIHPSNPASNSSCQHTRTRTYKQQKAAFIINKA